MSSLKVLQSRYKDQLLELSTVINGIVQLTGHDNATDTILTVQYDSAHFRNRGLVAKVAPKYYFKHEDKYSHLINISDIPKPLKMYVVNWRTNNTPKLIYEDNEDF